MKLISGIILTIILFASSPVYSLPEHEYSVESRNKYFTIYYRPEQIRLVSTLIKEADFFIERMTGELGLNKPDKRIVLVVDPGGVGNNEAYPVPKWIRGFYSHQDKMIVLKTVSISGKEQENELIQVFRHETVHALIHLNGCRIPRWLNEGLAVYYTTGFRFSDGRNLLTLNRHELKRALSEPSFNNGNNAQVSYSLSCGLVSYIMTLDSNLIRDILRKTRTENFETSFSSSFGTSFDVFLEIFKSEFLSQYTLMHLIISEEFLFVLISILALVLIVRKRIRDIERMQNIQDVPEFPDYWNLPIREERPTNEWVEGTDLDNRLT